MSKSSASQTAVAAIGRSTANWSKWVMSVVPWLIIGGLLWAGLFIKPAPVGSTVQPPVLERRDYFYGVARPADDRIWFAGSNGKIVSIAKDGRTERLATGTDSTLQDLATWDDQHSVAVGNDGVVIYSVDGGRTWQKSESVPRSQVANKFTRLRLGGADTAFAVGEMGALLQTKDAGKTWHRLRPEEDVAWNDVAILPDDRLLVVGEFGRISVSNDGGGAWADISPPVPTSLMAVAFKDAKLGVAVGLEGVVRVTRDGGQHWERMSVDTHDHIFDIAWDERRQQWVGGGSLGRWVTGSPAAENWRTGRLDATDLSWHTRVLPTDQGTWFIGANIGQWENTRWRPLGAGWQPEFLISLPAPVEKSKQP